jgi:hypothetical protein
VLAAESACAATLPGAGAAAVAALGCGSASLSTAAGLAAIAAGAAGTATAAGAGVAAGAGAATGTVGLVPMPAPPWCGWVYHHSAKPAPPKTSSSTMMNVQVPRLERRVSRTNGLAMSRPDSSVAASGIGGTSHEPLVSRRCGMGACTAGRCPEARARGGGGGSGREGGRSGSTEPFASCMLPE